MHANRPSALLDDPATDPLVLGVRTVRTVIVVRAVLALAFGMLIVFLVIAGSLWIMTNLNDNMMAPAELMDLHMQH